MLNLNIGKIRNIPGAKFPVKLSGEIDCATYGYQDKIAAGVVEFDGTAENAGQGVFSVNGQYRGELLLQCSRCAERFAYQVKGIYDGEYLAERLEQPDLFREEPQRGFSGDTIDLTPALLEEIYLELPMQPLCREDCRGLCPICGINLNSNSCSCGRDDIDPRWEKLKYLVDSKKGV
ncbi:MAG: DUF177 domain-containing protein [Clostridiales bacterium]